MNCYLCDQPLNAANKSIEHVIPNAIGGRIKSGDLLCNGCNSLLGEKFDAILCNQFITIANLLDVSREKGQTPKIRNLQSNNEQYNLHRGRHIELSNPVVTVSQEENQVHVVARNEKELQTILKGLKKKYPNLDLTNLEEKITRTRERLKEPLTGNFSIGGQAFLKSILKILINFYLLKKGDRGLVRLAIYQLKSQEKLDKDYVRYYSADNDSESDKIYHTIIVKGTARDKCLFGMIDLFSSFSFLVTLNSNYEGGDFEYKYRWDVCAAKEVACPVELSYPKGYQDSYSCLNEQLIEQVTNRLNRLVAIADERQFELMVAEIANDAIVEIFGSKQNRIPVTKELLENYFQKVAVDVAQLISYVGKQHD